MYVSRCMPVDIVMYVYICMYAYPQAFGLEPSALIQQLLTGMETLWERCPDCQGLMMKEENARPPEGEKLCPDPYGYDCFQASGGYNNWQCWKCRKMLLPKDFYVGKVKGERGGGGEWCKQCLAAAVEEESKWCEECGGLKIEEPNGGADGVDTKYALSGHPHPPHLLSYHESKKNVLSTQSHSMLYVFCCVRQWPML